MRFCGKMNDHIYVVLCKYLLYCSRIGDIGSYKCVILAIFDIFKILKITRICELIDIYYAYIIAIFIKHIVDEIGADEPCSSGYEIGFHADTFLPLIEILQTLRTIRRRARIFLNL